MPKPSYSSDGVLSEMKIISTISGETPGVSSVVTGCSHIYCGMVKGALKVELPWINTPFYTKYFQAQDGHKGI